MSELPRDDCYQEDLTVGFGGAAGHAIEIEAGSLGTWTFTYRCGDQPVRDGGAISFWNDQTNVPCAYLPQTTDPDGWDYVTAETDGDADLELVHLAKTYKDNRFCEVRVVRGELRHGDSVTLWVGAGQPTAAPAYSIERINYYVAVDHAGDGTWIYLPYCVTASIVPGPPAKLGVTAPSVIGLDEPFALHVRAEDENSNPGAPYVGESAGVSGRAVEVASGVRWRLRTRGLLKSKGCGLDSAGVHRLTVRSCVMGRLSATVQSGALPSRSAERADLLGRHALSCGLRGRHRDGGVEPRLCAEQGAAGFLQPDGPHLFDAGTGDRERSTVRRCWTCGRCGETCSGRRGPGTSPGDS